jgi:hypothetical protein
MREVLNGKPYAGNPHVWFDEGEAASATPSRGSLLNAALRGKQNAGFLAYSLTWGVRLVVAAWALVGGAASPVHARTLVWQNADPPPSTKAGAYAEYVLAFIETRPGDYDIGLATIDTTREVGLTLVIQ